MVESLVKQFLEKHSDLTTFEPEYLEVFRRFNCDIGLLEDSSSPKIEESPETILVDLIEELFTSKKKIAVWKELCEALKKKTRSMKIKFDQEYWKNEILKLNNVKIRWRKNGKVFTTNGSPDTPPSYSSRLITHFYTKIN